MRVSYDFCIAERCADQLSGNGRMLTVRIMRYSMDGLALCHVCAFIHYFPMRAHPEE